MISTSSLRKIKTFSLFERQHSTPRIFGSRDVSMLTVPDGQGKTATRVDDDV